MAPRASTPKTFPRQTAVHPKTWGLRSGAAESSEDLDAGQLSASKPALESCSQTRPAGTPPAETPNAKPYHGCHAKLTWQAWASPRLRRIIRRHQGFYTYPVRVSHWPVPATTAASVEPHTHHRQPLHAWEVLAPKSTWWHMVGKRMGALSPGRLPRVAYCRHEIHASAARPHTPDLQLQTGGPGEMSHESGLITVGPDV